MTQYQSLALRSNRTFYGRNKTILTKSSLPRVQYFGIITKSFLAGMFLLVGLMFYVSESTKAGNLSIDINNLSGQLNDLSRQNQALEYEATKSSSIESIQNSDVAKSMVEPASVTIIR
jgi:hypothetical protein